MAANIAKRLWEIGDIVDVEPQDMMVILGAFVVIGVFVIWCDVTDGWSNMHRRIGALLPLIQSRPMPSPSLRSPTAQPRMSPPHGRELRKLPELLRRS